MGSSAVSISAAALRNSLPACAPTACVRKIGLVDFTSRSGCLASVASAVLKAASTSPRLPPIAIWQRGICSNHNECEARSATAAAFRDTAILAAAPGHERTNPHDDSLLVGFDLTLDVGVFVAEVLSQSSDRREDC